MSQPVIVIGAGGHGKVLADALLASGILVLGFTDINPTLSGTEMLGLPVLGTDDCLSEQDRRRVQLVNGLGWLNAPNKKPARQLLQNRLEQDGWCFASVTHPRAIISPFAELATSVQVMAGAVIQTGVRVGSGTVINTTAVIEHDAVIGSFCHIAPGSVLCGNTRIGDGSLVGAGSVVLQQVSLGVGTVLAAGAVATRDIDDAGNPWMGVPARLKGHLT